MSDNHIPVMLTEVLEAIAPRDGAIYVDGTFGAGGYSRALLDAADCRVVGIDRDPDALAAGAAITDASDGRLTLMEGRFGALEDLLRAGGIEAVDGVALDIGVSSMQLDKPERGFSFRGDGPLDMRMGRDGPTAADLVNNLPERELAKIIYNYGEELRARQIAKAIVGFRGNRPFTRTGELADLVRGVVGRSHDGLDPATRTFQSLRIFVNDELGELDRGLSAAERMLRSGGRLAVVTFHSLEDRRVKTFLRERSGDAPLPSRHLPPAKIAPATFSQLRRRVQRPGAAETDANPRARSARLRAAERTKAPIAEDAK